MTVCPVFNRAWFNLARVLRQAWQCVVFAEDRDDRAASACFANYGSGQASGVVGDAKSLFHQQFAVGSAGFKFRVQGFRRVKYIVGQFDEALRVIVGEDPDLVFVFHGITPSNRGER